MIRDLATADRAEFLRLWQGYLSFYQVTLQPEVTEATWTRLIDPASPLKARVAIGASPLKNRQPADPSHARATGATLPPVGRDGVGGLQVGAASDRSKAMAPAGGDTRLLGFAIHLHHPSTWVPGQDCYLEDLFVDAAARGQGLGRALIEDLMVLAHARGWHRLYWHTNEDNLAARRLYDRIVASDGHIRYRLTLS